MGMVGNTNENGWRSVTNGRVTGISSNADHGTTVTSTTPFASDLQPFSLVDRLREENFAQWEGLWVEKLVCDLVWERVLV